MASGKGERRGVGSPLGQKKSRRGAVRSHGRLSIRTPHILVGEEAFFSFERGPTHIPPNMLHPLIIGIVTVNTSLTIIYWSFLLGDAYFKWLMEPEDKPKKVVTPA